jgi:hypothetical protein
MSELSPIGTFVDENSANDPNSVGSVGNICCCSVYFPLANTNSFFMTLIIQVAWWQIQKVESSMLLRKSHCHIHLRVKF